MRTWPEEMTSLALFIARDGNDAGVGVDPTVFPSPQAFGVILAELPDHIANAYTSSGSERRLIVQELRRIILAEWANPTGKAQEVEKVS